MNVGTLDMLSANQRADVRADLDGLLTDTEIGATVSFRAIGSRVYDPRSGAVSYAETITSTTAVLSPLTTKELGSVAGAQVGDAWAYVSATAITTRPTTGDRLIDASSIPYDVLSVESYSLGTHYRLMIRRTE